MMRGFLFTALVLLPLGFFATHAFAANGFIGLAPIPGLTSGEVANSSDFPAFFNNLYKYLIGLSAALAIIMITWEGLRISANRDSVSVIIDSKGKIYNAIFGLVLVLSPALVFGIINPRILDLRLNLDQINLDFPSYTSTVTTGPSSNAGGVPAGTSNSSSAQAGQWCYTPPSGGFRCSAQENTCLMFAASDGIRPPPSPCTLTPP